jgi:hypothetical protein
MSNEKAITKAASTLTQVRLLFIEERVNVWLRFGHFVKERTIDPHTRDAYFVPHSIFGVVTWRGSDHGTTEWRVDVLRTAEAGERASRVPGVTPGAEILLRASGESKVRKLLLLFDDIEARGIKLIAVSPDYWRCAHNRLAANLDVPVHSIDGHEAFLVRKDLAS